MATERVRVGDLVVIALLDGTIELPLERVFSEVSTDEFAPYRARYPEAFGDGTWRVPVRCFLIRSASATLLVDTGMGPSPLIADIWHARPGHLATELAAADVRGEDVDTVVLTHIHLDHVGGVLRDDDAPARLAFPRARYLIHRKDWERAKERADTPAMARCVLPLERLGALEMVERDRALSDEVTLLHTPGHTPGHLTVLVTSQSERAILVGDALHHPAHVSEPCWRDRSDSDHGAAVAMRRLLLERIEAEGMTVAPSHFPSPFGRVISLEGRRYWQAL